MLLLMFTSLLKTYRCKNESHLIVKQHSYGRTGALDSKVSRHLKTGNFNENLLK